MLPLIGHAARWQAITRSYSRHRIPQTLLISGPPHVGKRIFARRLAQLLLCPNASPETLEPCGSCRVCHQVEIETFPDFKVYRPLVGASEKDIRDRNIAPRDLEGAVIPIEIAREFGEEAMLKPLIGKRKVMLVEGAEKLTIPAQNSLLKTFEEPVNGLSIVLLSDNPGLLLSTVLSRAWHLPLGLAPDAAIGDWLRTRFEGATPAQIEEAVRASAGRPGAAFLALKRLEDEEGAPSRFAQMSAFAGKITAFGPVGALALSEEAGRIAKEWWDEDIEAADAKAIEGAKATRTALARFLDELGAVYRAQWEELQRQGETRHADKLARGLDLVRQTRHYLLRNANSSLALDVLFGRLIALHKPPT